MSLKDPSTIKKLEDASVAAHSAARKYRQAWVEQGDEKALQSYIYAVLAPIIKDQSHTDKLFGEKAMKEWVKVFTHVSFNREINYEKYEKIGDAIAKVNFLKFLYKYYPQISKPGDIAVQTDVNMSNETMSIVTKKLGLDLMLRTNEDIVTKVLGDILEGLFGALEQIADTIQFGFGSAYSYALMYLCMGFIKIDPNQKKDPRTYVKEIYDKLGQDEPEVQSRAIGDKRVRITVINSATGEVMGVGEGPEDSRDARDAAYSEVIKYLQSRGITPETAQYNKLQRDLKDPEYNKQYARVTKAVEIINSKIRGSNTITGFVITPVTESGRKGNTASLSLISKDIRTHQTRQVEQLRVAGPDFKSAQIAVMKKFADEAGVEPELSEQPAAVVVRKGGRR